ncbi:unnamed protein product [Rotaria sp. Silwood1]|nr:unnamed protein product [Rotaria sp. Silwood1]
MAAPIRHHISCFFYILCALFCISFRLRLYNYHIQCQDVTYNKQNDIVMATIESDEDVYDDWSALAPSYQDVFLPRFQPMYDTIAHYIVKKIQSKDTNDEYKVLDYGTGTY